MDLQQVDKLRVRFMVNCCVEDLVIQPWGAILIGIIAGMLSVVGYVYIQPCLEKKIGLYDTCGVNNLHGMVSV